MVSAWLKSCYNVSAVTIALVFNTFDGQFLWVVIFLHLGYFLSYLRLRNFSKWKLISLKDFIFNYQNNWMSFTFLFSSSNRIFQIIRCSVSDASVFSNIWRFDGIRKRFNSSAISVSSFRISSFSKSFIFLPKVLLFVKNGFITFKKFYYRYNKCIEIVKELFSFFFIKLAAIIFLLLVGFWWLISLFLKIYLFRFWPSHNCFSQGFSCILQMIFP